ncbi:MAG: diaminopimelate epimerase [Clostridium butyricum]|nr:diaminopimelate epimerase [Clostridium butyricum]
MNFYKMQGAGNDFVFVEDLNNEIEEECKLAVKLCDRHFGIGADGLVIVRKSEKAEAKMIIINADGSRANMCGNAIRCFGKYVYEHKIVTQTKFKVETGDGVKIIEVILDAEKVKYVRVYMGVPSYDAKDIPLNEVDGLIDAKIDVNNKSYNVTTLLMGVPHTVVFETNREYDVINEGMVLEKYKYFKEGSNINFVKIIDDTHIRVNTWERGAGFTLACGTGCCASVVVAKRLGLVDKDKDICVQAPGGELIIEVVGNDVYMKGPAEVSFEGKTELDLNI